MIRVTEAKRRRILRIDRIPINAAIRDHETRAATKAATRDREIIPIKPAHDREMKAAVRAATRERETTARNRSVANAANIWIIPSITNATMSMANWCPVDR